MSHNSARAENMYTDDIDEIDAIMVGDPIKGTMYVAKHHCPECHAEMETLGVGHAVYNCSNCFALRSRNVVMKSSIRPLENK